MAPESDSQKLPVWDQVLAFGEYQHHTVDGQPTLTIFDASKCRFMLEDFASRKNDIFIDKQHEVVELQNDKGEPLNLDEMDLWARGTTGQYGYGEGDGRALGWANALAMIVGGQVVQYEAHPGAPAEAPNIEDLRRSDGSLPLDGICARRHEITPLGADPKEGFAVYRYTSPYFLPHFVQTKDGWRLLNYTATNNPRMQGVALAMGQRVAMQMVARSSRRQQMENAKMADLTPEMMAAAMKAAGCAEGDSPEVAMKKMTAYAMKMADDQEAMRAKMESDDKDKKDDEDEEKKEKASKMEASILKRALDEQRAATQAIQDKLAASENERIADRFAMDAGKYLPESEARELIKTYGYNTEKAMAFAQKLPERTQGVSSFGAQTMGGGIRGSSTARTSSADGEKVVMLGRQAFQLHGQALSVAAKKRAAEKNIDLGAAQLEIAKENPSLA